METETSKLHGTGFEGELAEKIIDPIFYEAGITETERKRVYCFGPGNGTELVALSQRFLSVRACESSPNFFQRCSQVIENSNLANTTLIEGDAVLDLEEEASKGHSYDVVTLFGFGPPYALDSKKIKQTILAANGVLSNGGRIIVTSDMSTLTYLHKQLRRIYDPQDEPHIVTTQANDAQVSAIVLDKTIQDKIGALTFAPFSTLEKLSVQARMKNDLPDPKIIKMVDR